MRPERKLLAMRSQGSLLAWDPVQQKEAWRVNFGAIASAGTLATGGKPRVSGYTRGELVAYSADKDRNFGVGKASMASPPAPDV